MTPADLLVALGAIAAALLAAAVVRRPARLNAAAQTRLALAIFIGGMAAYLLYGIGWLRPNEWLGAAESVAARRAALSGLVLVFGWLGYAIERRAGKRPTPQT